MPRGGSIAQALLRNTSASHSGDRPSSQRSVPGRPRGLVMGKVATMAIVATLRGIAHCDIVQPSPGWLTKQGLVNNEFSTFLWG